MPPGNEVTIWRAPSPHCRHPAREIIDGFDPADYPGNGLYLATDQLLAESFQPCHGNGLQEMFMPRDLFDDLIDRGIIQPDGYYAPGRSWHVLPADLAAFNAAIRQGTPNRYHP